VSQAQGNIFQARGMSDANDTRFDRKYLQEDIILESIQKEIQNIIPQILTNVSSTVSEHCHSKKEEEDRHKKNKTKM
jgi:hypothetical protein